MLKNYIKIAWRNLLKNRVSSTINISGLALGMAVAIIIGLWVWDELSFDTNFRNYDSIAQVYSKGSLDGQPTVSESKPRPLEFELRNKYGSSFKHIVMSRWTEDRLLSFGEKKLTKGGRFMQSGAPDMLSLEMIKGSRSGLKDLSSLLISASTEKALFGDQDAMGKTIIIDNTMHVKVTGVYKDLPRNCQFEHVNFIAPWDLLIANQKWVDQAADDWDNYSFLIYVQIQPNTTYEAVSARIKTAMHDNADEENKKFNVEVFLHPMRRWHLYSEWKDGLNTGGQAQFVWLIGTIGTFVLLLACINFINLSTARSEKRAKEVGVRKAVGSSRIQLIKQFVCESYLIVLVAFVFAIALVIITLPWFNNLVGKKMAMQWVNPTFWLCSLAFIAITGLVAGSYPAFYLSSFNPIKVLKGTFSPTQHTSVPRKALVVLQFTVSVTLIVGTLIVYRQIQHAKNRTVGYDKNGLLAFRPKSPEMIWKQKILIDELKNASLITEAALSNSALTDTWSKSGDFEWKGKKSSQYEGFGIFWVTHDYGQTIGWKLKDGRNFSRKFSRDSTSNGSNHTSGIIYNVMINEAAAKYMNLSKPVGEIIRWNGSPLRIIGLVKDQITDSPYQTVKHNIYMVNYDEATSWLYLRLNPKQNIPDVLTKMEAIFEKVVPSVSFDYRFIDVEYGKKFEEEEQIGKLATIFASLAIFISCLGLFGLASFVAEQRTKEFGIRKVLGASVLDLWRIMSASFITLVIIACLIAIPTAWYFLNQWLQKYEYRTEISPWILAATCLGALAITLLTVSFQAIKAAVANPVKNLRTE